MDDQALEAELRLSLSEIEMQIKHIKNDIAREYEPSMRSKINVWYWTRHVDGRYVLEGLLVAKANVLSAMVALRARSANS